MRIRHFGFLANRGRKEKLERIRKALAVNAPPEKHDGETQPGDAGYPGPQCRTGRLAVIAQIAPSRPPWRPPDTRH